MNNDFDTESIKSLLHDNALAFLLVAVATAAVIVTTYHLVNACICNRRRPRRDGHTPLRLAPPATPARADRILVEELIPAHKFRKGERDDVVRSVCLSEFEEGEEMRDLAGCGHAFHALCIDMRLFSQLTCPTCRADVTPLPVMLREAAAETRLDFGALEDHVDMIQSRRSSV